MVLGDATIVMQLFVVCAVANLCARGFVQNVVVIAVLNAVDKIANLDKPLNFANVLFGVSRNMDKVSGRLDDRDFCIGVAFCNKQAIVEVKIGWDIIIVKPVGVVAQVFKPLDPTIVDIAVRMGVKRKSPNNNFFEIHICI